MRVQEVIYFLRWVSLTVLQMCCDIKLPGGFKQKRVKYCSTYFNIKLCRTRKQTDLLISLDKKLNIINCQFQIVSTILPPTACYFMTLVVIAISSKTRGCFWIIYVSFKLRKSRLKFLNLILVSS